MIPEFPELPPIPEVVIELLPEERRTLLKRIFIPEIVEQLEPLAASDQVETIRLTGGLVHLVASDLTHEIVRGSARDDATIELSERFDYIDDTRDGQLAGW